jgi:hypothetical protein
MMATYAGKNGKLSLLAPSGNLEAPSAPTVANTVGNVTDWRLTVEQELLDTTGFGDQFRKYTFGLRGWNASVECVWDADTAANNQDELWEAILSSDFSGTLPSSQQIQVNLYVEGETAGSRKVYYGAAFVESVEVHVPVENRVTASFRLRGNGTLKYTGTGA